MVLRSLKSAKLLAQSNYLFSIPHCVIENSKIDNTEFSIAKNCIHPKT